MIVLNKVSQKRNIDTSKIIQHNGVKDKKRQK